jgi:ubiquinone/menaquinone biosynthesis C-methylase UbiE
MVARGKGVWRPFLPEVMMNQSAKFWDKIAERYAKRPIADEAVYQKKLQVTREHFRPGMEVLEFGCGTGSTAIAHAPYVKHIQAIDISSKMIEIAQSKADAKKIENVTFKCSTIEELSVREHTLDAVLGLSILHLLENKEEVIARVHRMLKPGGIFVTSTACIGDTMKFFKAIVPIGRFLRLIPVVKIFTTTELEESLTAGGFSIDSQWQPGKGKSVFIVALKG